MNQISLIECVCCPERCKSFSFFPSCDPLNPMRPVFREYLSAVTVNPVSSSAYLLPNGKIKRVPQQPSLGQLDLFGGVL